MNDFSKLWLTSTKHPAISSDGDDLREFCETRWAKALWRRSKKIQAQRSECQLSSNNGCVEDADGERWKSDQREAATKCNPDGEGTIWPA